MAFLLGTEKAHVVMPSKTVLEEVSIGVSEGDRIGIVGLNGDGKSTLVRLLAGDLEPDNGRVVKTTGVNIGLLRQSDQLNDDETVQFAIFQDRPEYEWASDPKVREILDGLLFDIVLDQLVGNLSGGQRHRVDLARLLVGNWDVLMLDEPTNHLDMRTITWLAEHLKTRWRAGAGALLVISHDRWFLDEVCNLMWEVYNGGVLIFEGGFSAYIMQRVERARIAQVTEQRRQNRLARELAWLSRGARARATKPKFHVKAARELIADVPELRKPPQLNRVAMARIGKDFVDLQGVTVEFPQGQSASEEGEANSNAPKKRVLDNINWILGPGERIGIVGENGVGKSTLLNVIRGKLKPTSGRAKIGSTVKFAMLSQRLDDLSEHDNERVRELVGRYGRRQMSDGSELTPTKILEDLGFKRDDLNEFIRSLSGGQRRRLALMMVLMEEANVLILDEPGNDLDIDMLAALEDMLDAWPGTLILVTHDRNMMERVTDDQYAIIDGSVRHLPGGIDEYLRIRREAESTVGSSDVHGKAAGSASNAGDEVVQPESSPSQMLSNKERQRLVKLVASLEKKISTLEGKIADAKAALDAAEPTDYEELTALQKNLDELNSNKDELEMQWLEASEALG